ncbi:MAG: AI-2E family transporter [Pseudomonadota bacterium]|nr:AI-2E family transporter [Pseudomonadota bacterium]
MKNYLNKTNVILGLVAVALIWFIGAVKAILMPFILAFVLAYILHPIVEKLVSKKWGRGVATGLVVGGFCLCVVAIALILVPLLQSQTVDFIKRIPKFSEGVWERVKSLLAYTKDTITQEQLSEIYASVSGTVTRVLTAIGVSVSHILSSGVALFNIVALILITPVVLFYVLRDWGVIQQQIGGLMPKHKEKEILSLWGEIDKTLSGFIRGQTLVCLSLAIFYAMGLFLVGLDYGVLVGLLAGILSFIPYFGFGTGLVLSLFLGFMQGLSWGGWTGLAIVFVLGQILEGYVLTPKLVGNRVGLHPVWVMFALLAGGVLGGFIGILIAVPVAAVVGVLLRHGLKWYRETEFYRGRKKI